MIFPLAANSIALVKLQKMICQNDVHETVQCVRR